MSKYNYDKSKITVVNATEVIETCEVPTVAIKQKKDSSMVVGLNMVKKGRHRPLCLPVIQVLCLQVQLLLLVELRGRKTCLGTLLPTEKGHTLLIDAGANVDAKPSYFPQFALMGSIYYENVMGVKEPKVGLVNIGVEESKGNAVVKEAYGL